MNFFKSSHFWAKVPIVAGVGRQGFGALGFKPYLNIGVKVWTMGGEGVEIQIQTLWCIFKYDLNMV